MSDKSPGRILGDHKDLLRESYERLNNQAIDWDLSNGNDAAPPAFLRTIEKPVTLTGPGTFFGKATRTITIEPCESEGWWFDRSDMPGHLPTKVSIRNVWTTGETVSNIVLRSGSPHNYVRMVEHMIALKLGLSIDNLMIRIDSGDPPLFDRGSLNLVEAIEKSGIKESETPVKYITVKEKVTMADSQGSFVTLAPCTSSLPLLTLDCAIHFPTAIGAQRIHIPLTHDHFVYGAEARTNTSAAKMLFCKTIGKVFANIRNLGYTKENVLVAGKHRYINRPKLNHQDKSLEAVWHRAVLDLTAALALVEPGRFVGDVTSYKAGHRLDVALITQLYLHDLLTEFTPGKGD